jgi:quinolinate synthase
MVSPAVSPSLNLFQEIDRLKKEMNAVILAHYYQEPDIQDIADYMGDSLGLARQAADTSADVIVFCGVHFMAETAKILNPTKLVLLPDLDAGCSLAEGCPEDQFAAFCQEHPDHLVISYVNCSAGVKALSDIICTSSNAVSIVNQIPQDKPIIFGPDKNLGRYVMEQTGRDMLLWPGTCIVHEMFSEKKLVQLKMQYPDAEVIAHPECEEPVLKLADFIASTTGLLLYTQRSASKAFIVVTEAGIIHQMEQASPHKKFIPAPPDNECACNECPFMRLNTLEKVYLCMKNRTPELVMDEAIRLKALGPIQKMLEMSLSKVS